MTGNWHRAASVEEIDPDEPLGVKVEGKRIALYKLDGAVYATADECTHAFARLSHGYLEGHEILCPVHQGRFDVKTGAATGEPACDPVKTYPVELRDGAVFVDLG